MFPLEIRLTETAVRTMKAELSSALPHIKSSHLTEALARGLGFGSHAALLAALSSKPDGITAHVGLESFADFLEPRGERPADVVFLKAAGRIALRDTIARVDTLALHGVGHGAPQRKPEGGFENPYEHHDRFLSDRVALEREVDGFLLSLGLLERLSPTKTVRSGAFSYRLKHVAEKHSFDLPDGSRFGPTYVTNGAFIAAAICRGYDHRITVDGLGYFGPNATFNMPARVVADLDREIRGRGR